MPVVKICGLREGGDAELCVELGASYLGCVLAADSPRRATLNQVRAIAEIAGGRASVVLVFRGNSGDQVMRACALTGVRRVQIHGLNPMAANALRLQGLQVHPVYQVTPGAAVLPEFAAPSPRRPAILDTGRGGTGVPFGWHLLGDRAPAATLIAGGVTPDNVAELLRRRPYGIDVSSGIESAPGCKDHAALRRLFANLGCGVVGEVGS